MKKSYNILAMTGMVLLMSAFTCIQSVPVLAASAVTAAPPYQKVLDTMNGLHLSAEELEIEEGEIYQIDVCPAEHAAPLGWEIAGIELDDDLVGQIRPQELAEGTRIKKFDENGKESDMIFSAEGSQEHTADLEASDRETAGLCFYLVGKKTGSARITVNLANPAWEKAYGAVLPPLSVKMQTTTLAQGTKAARQEAEKAVAGTPVSGNANMGGSQQQPSDPSGGNNPGIVPGDGSQADLNNWLEKDSLEYVYDGKTHVPVFNLPAGYSISGLTGGMNAGSYSDQITVRDASGNIVSTATVNYTIKPSTVVIRHLYDAVNGTVITDISGVVDADVISVQDNSRESSLTKAGRYEVSTSIDIDESKLGNYILEDGQSSVKKADAYQVVGNNPWFEVKMDYTISEADSQLTVNFYLENLRTEQVGNNATNLFVLDMCIYYDENLLSYSSNNQYNNWRIDTCKPDGHKQTYTPDVSSGPVSVAPDLTVTYTGMCKGLKGDGNKTLMCSLTYDIKEGGVEALTNSVITADQINYDAHFDLRDPAGNTDIPARYWADPVSVLICPDGSVEEHEIIIESDPAVSNATPHESVCSPGTIQEIQDRLHQYIDQNMTDTKTVTPSDELPAVAAQTALADVADEVSESACEKMAGESGKCGVSEGTALEGRADEGAVFKAGAVQNAEDVTGEGAIFKGAVIENASDAESNDSSKEAGENDSAAVSGDRAGTSDAAASGDRIESSEAAVSGDSADSADTAASGSSEGSADTADEDAGSNPDSEAENSGNDKTGTDIDAAGPGIAADME